MKAAQKEWCFPRFHSTFPLVLAATLFAFAGNAAPVELETQDDSPFVAEVEEHVFESPQQRRQFGQADGRVFKDRVSPQWFQNNTRFWYRNDLRGGTKEFVLVDAENGTRALAFDHAKLATALSKATGTEQRPDKLPFDSIEFTDDGKAVRFKTDDRSWECDLQSYEVREAKEALKSAEKSTAPRASPAARSARTGEEVFVTFVNRTQGEVELFWLSTEGERQSYAKLASGGEHRQHTFAGHVWLAVDAQGNELARFEATTDKPRVEITRTPQTQQRSGQRGQRQGGGLGGGDATSPDRKWTALVKENNLFIRGEDGKEIQLSTDGKEGLAYGRPSWSPDSKTLVAFRIEPGERKDVYLVQSSPPGGGRAKLQTRGYDLPGDKFAAYELNLFDVATSKQIKPEVERVDFGTPRVRWNKDGRHFSYQKVDRGHQRFRVIEVDAQTGVMRNLIDEKSETFIWTAHTETLGLSLINWLENTDEIIYVSERDGWRHLYLVDAKAGVLKNPITKGEGVVRGIERIDEDTRQVWFRASGVFPDQDPYLVHYGRVDFDGSGLVWLTVGNGNHTVQFSPDRKFIVDTCSRVDLPAVNELRRVADGKLVCKLEEADIADLKSSGWEAPEVFVAKARDGKTDIWGIITRPRGLDAKQKYPIIEDIYAGPQGSFVPKTFSAASRYESLNRLGFIVVKIDGMGTANRSKAFHDVCFKNLKDAGFEDRILWMKAAAKKYPYLDITRVGVYGTSAGGQNAAGAVLFHPEFYKAAVANCGCHDNRMDKASWNEQWMGYLPPEKLYSKDADNWYSASSNIDNAHRLRGALFLIVGEMDTNVPPESTYRFVDALIKAGKDFDFLVVPNGGHGAGGQYAARRREDFFLRHLMGKEPPNRNETALPGGSER
jgi:dipeptidyl aminopeptidase/acylaminoacyl peptidase